MNSNRFCLFLLLITVILIIVGIFLIVTSLHYEELPDEEFRTEIRRDVGEIDSNPHHKEPFPVFPEDYHASGLLILPHSAIAEPFEIWYSNSLGASRIDYYYGTDKSFQRGDEQPYGKYYKIVPMYNDQQGNFEGCWTMTGRKKWPIFAQTIIPNITWFKYVKTEVYTGTLATKWHYEYWAYGMLNSQNVWVTKSKPYKPIRYEMKGYDSMLGSYYDHYVLEYVSFEQWRPQIKRFELPRSITCFNWSLTLESSLIANPMQEFTSFSAEHLVDTDEMFHDFKNSHGKKYDDEKEHKKRKHIYKHNMRFIRSMNRKKKHYKLKSNHFTDMSNEEFENHVGSITKADPRNHTGMKPLHKHDPVYLGKAPTPVDIPEELDWRDFGAVSGVKGQGICGSCYTFSAAGAAEGAHFLKTGKLVELSSQQILDCSWGSGNHGCKGGHYAAALSFLYLHGAATLDSYGKYLAQEGACHFNDTLLGAKIDAFAYVPRYNNTALKHAIAKFGPAAVSINVSPLSFKFYSSGVYYDEDCWANRTRHSALVIGYGKVEHGKEYWLVKNSWSDSWGERGYIKVAMDNNMCGITESPVVALVNHITFQFPVKEKINSVDIEEPATLGRRVKAAAQRESKPKEAESQPSEKESKLDEEESKPENTESKPDKVEKITSKGEESETKHRKAAKILKDIDKELKKELNKGLIKDIINEKDKENGGKDKGKKLKNKTKNKSKVKDKKKDSKISEAFESKEDIPGKDASKVSAGKSSDQEKNSVFSLPQKTDEKETPKIEPHDEKHDIGALGDAVATAASEIKEEIGVKSGGSKNEGEKGDKMSFQQGESSKGKSDDFKIPVFKGNVDQSKLPNAFSENSKPEVNEVGKHLPTFNFGDQKDGGEGQSLRSMEGGEVEGGGGGGGVNLAETPEHGKVLYHSSEKGVEVTVQDPKGESEVEVSVSKEIETKTENKKKLKNKKIKQKTKKVGKNKKKGHVDGKPKTAQNGKLPISKRKLHKVLKETLKNLYSKIDNALLKVKNV